MHPNNREQLTPPALQERIRRGIDLLDQSCPGWREKVDLYTLDMNSCKNCVLGQIYGDIHTGVERLELIPHSSTKTARTALIHANWTQVCFYGFGLGEYEFNDLYSHDGPGPSVHLTQMWREELTRKDNDEFGI